MIPVTVIQIAVVKPGISISPSEVTPGVSTAPLVNPRVHISPAKAGIERASIRKNHRKVVEVVSSCPPLRVEDQLQGRTREEALPMGRTLAGPGALRVYTRYQRYPHHQSDRTPWCRRHWWHTPLDSSPYRRENCPGYISWMDS
jgi:hypothetical protein